MRYTVILQCTSCPRQMSSQSSLQSRVSRHGVQVVAYQEGLSIWRQFHALTASSRNCFDQQGEANASCLLLQPAHSHAHCPVSYADKWQCPAHPCTRQAIELCNLSACIPERSAMYCWTHQQASCFSPWYPGTTGTLAEDISAFASLLSPAQAYLLLSDPLMQGQLIAFQIQVECLI